jgi:putative ABC transport system permease protein
MISIGQGATKQISDRISSMGSNLLMVSPSSGQSGAVRGAGGGVTTLKVADGDAIKGLKNVVYVAPELGSNATISYSNQTWTASYTGTTPEYEQIKDWPTSSGTYFSDNDVANAAPVVLLGQTIVENLFTDGSDPIGATVRINRVSFTVLGVLSAKSGGMGQNQDNTALMPVSTAQRRMTGYSHVTLLNVQVDATENMSAVQTSIEELLRQRHRINAGANDDFSISNLTTVQETVESTTAILTLFLAGVAAISLLVGGIGIMNIMLVSVTERTREIGLRMAVGATESDIRNQFLVEALALCLAGGLIGILLGISGSKLVGALSGWTATVAPSSILLATGFAVAIGVFFGYYPAKKAAGLDPIEALRFEK